MNALVMDPAMILAAAAELRETTIKDKTYRLTPIGHHAGRYLDQLEFDNFSDKTVTNREQTLAWFSIDHAHMQIGQVTQDTLEMFLAHHWKDSAVNTRAQHVSSLRTFFAWAHDHDIIPADPARRLKTPKATDSTREAHTAATVRKLIVGQQTQRDRVGILFLYWCALRRNELRLIQFRHIDLANRILIVFGKGRTVMEQNLSEPLALELERLILQRAPHPDEYLLHPQHMGRYGRYPLYSEDVIWEDRMRPLTTSGIDKWWQRAVTRAGLERFPMHEIRHTAGTDFHREGHDLVATQHFMRHKNPATTAKTYVHLDRVRAVADVQRRMPDPLDVRTPDDERE